MADWDDQAQSIWDETNRDAEDNAEDTTPTNREGYTDADDNLVADDEAMED
jgi:hypothetical protein